MNRKVLITTPDYPPDRIGGISTFVLNLEKALTLLDIEYSVHVWRDVYDLPSELLSYSCVINAHFHFLLKMNHPNMITFIHGGELFSYSKNIAKRLVKSLFHKRIISSLDKSSKNIFISQYTQNLYASKGGELNYQRDLVFHNCIDLNNSTHCRKKMDEEINLCCFVRDVPHKNIAGTIKLYKKIKKLHSSEVKLYVTSNVEDQDPNIISLDGISDSEREEIYKKAHINLLLSLDHSHVGNIEGFGLTVLEAGKYGTPSIVMNTGGLVESVHDNETGWVINDQTNIKSLYFKILKSYEYVSRTVYEHTHKSHGIEPLSRLLDSFV